MVSYTHDENEREREFYDDDENLFLKEFLGNFKFIKKRINN